MIGDCLKFFIQCLHYRETYIFVKQPWTLKLWVLVWWCDTGMRMGMRNTRLWRKQQSFITCRFFHLGSCCVITKSEAHPSKMHFHKSRLHQVQWSGSSVTQLLSRRWNTEMPKICLLWLCKKGQWHHYIVFMYHRAQTLLFVIIIITII